MSRARTIAGLALLAILGCNNNNGSAISFAFNRPEQLGFACLAQYASTGTADPTLNGSWKELPLSCCNLYNSASLELGEGTHPDQAAAHLYCYGTDTQPLGSATLHALVTQSTRGEVAAVDLVANRVLDSDRQIPGFTFVDSGGLPSAIVVPRSQPKGDGSTGPTFIYVASAEQNAVRAIPTCRFRNGSSCGPDRTAGNRADPVAYSNRLRVPLPAAPADMILGPDQALWVTVPDRGELWRVALPAAGDLDNAFALDAAGSPQQAQRFVVPPMQQVEPPEPVMDSANYETSCGLGAAYMAGSFTLPTAPRAVARETAEPGRFRYDDESGLLFVSDRLSPGVHVFRTGLDGSLTALGAMPTGQPLRDFVITPRVPSSAVSGQALLARTAAAEDESGETKRYLYGIDAQGTVAVFDFAADDAGNLPTLTPLLVPVPDLGLVRYADRIALPTPSQALELIDTREGSDYVCGEESIDDLRARQAVLNQQKPLTTEVSRELARVAARIGVYDTAASDYLRGVFVAVVSTAGRLAMLDVHDLDVSCRAQKYCCASDASAAGANGVPSACAADASGALLDVPRSSDAQESLAVRRHAVHRRSVGPQTAEAGTQSLLQTLVCDASDPHASVQLLPVEAGSQTGRVCAPADPYAQLSETWNVLYQGTLPASAMAYAHWEAVPGNDLQLVLVAPAEFDVCARGVEVGDLVAVLGKAPEGLRTECPDPSADSAALFVIREATRDRLTVEPASAAAVVGETDAEAAARVEAARAQVAKALHCYPDFVGVELRASDFLVIGSGNTYLHRVVAGPDGACVTDTSQDVLLDARVRTAMITPSEGAAMVEAEVFHNPYVRFALAPAANQQVLPKTRETTVTISRASLPFYLDTVISGDSVTDALPSTLQYLPEQEYLFLLDTAGQGLRRYTLRPFQRETTVFR